MLRSNATVKQRKALGDEFFFVILFVTLDVIMVKRVEFYRRVPWSRRSGTSAKVGRDGVAVGHRTVNCYGDPPLS